MGEPHESHGAHAWGVEPEDLARVHIIRFDFQVGAAITLPVPILGPAIFIKSKWLDFEGQELRDDRSLSLLRHELCHVAQIRRWGAVSYVMRHLWARVHTFSVLARSSSVEAGCYEVQRQFRNNTFSPM